MSHRQTRRTFRSEIATPSGASKRLVHDDGFSSSLSSEDADCAWNRKNDGGKIAQNHFGTKRKGTKKAASVKREIEEVSFRTGGNERKRVRPESVQSDGARSEVSGDNEGVETKPDQTIDDGAAELEGGDLADTEDDQQIIHGVPETRRSGRARKPVQRFDDDKYAPFGRPVNSIFQANDVSKAMKKLKEARAGLSSRSREVSMSESPDPIALYSNDLAIGMATEDTDHAPEPEHESEVNQFNIARDPPTLSQQVAHTIPPLTSIEPKKSALKQKASSGPRKKRGVVIDETKNTTRSIKIISSTSSDIGRSPGLPGGGPGSRGGRGRGRGRGRGGGRGRGRGRGSMRFGVRPRNLIPINPDVLARRTVPVFGMSGTGERIVQKYRYVVSSDSDLEEVTSDGDDPLGTQRRAHSRGTMIDKDNRIFLLSLAARTNTRPDSSALPPSGPEEEYETQVTRIGTLVSRSLTPTRPSLPFKSKHPDNIEQEKVWKMFVDTMNVEWMKRHQARLRQVVVFGPPTAQGARIDSSASQGNVLCLPATTYHLDDPHRQKRTEGSQKGTETKQEVKFLAGQASLPEPIARPGFDFEKARERLAGLEIADRGMGMRLHLPEKKRIKF